MVGCSNELASNITSSCCLQQQFMEGMLSNTIVSEARRNWPSKRSIHVLHKVCMRLAAKVLHFCTRATTNRFRHPATRRRLAETSASQEQISLLNAVLCHRLEHMVCQVDLEIDFIVLYGR